MACVGSGYLVRAINAIYTIRTIVCVCVCVRMLRVTANCQLFRAYRLYRIRILIRKTVYGLFGCCLFSFRFWCVINAHRKFQQHHDTNKRRSASSMLWLGSMNEQNQLAAQHAEWRKFFCLSVSLSACLAVFGFLFIFLVYWFLLWRRFLGIRMTSCPRLNYENINRPISIIFLSKG